MNKKILWVILPLAVAAVGLTVLRVLFSSAGSALHKPNSSVVFQTTTTTTPTIGVMDATPLLLTVNTPTTVTATIQITNPAVIPASINLLQISESGNPLLIGVMHDDGLGGDAVAGDKTFTLRSILTAKRTGGLDLFISASVRGILQRVVSPTFTISVVSGFTTTFASQGLSFVYPANFISSATTLSYDQPVTLSDIGVSSEPAIGAPFGCDIWITVDGNPSLQPLSEWITIHSRTDGTNTTVTFGGLQGIRKSYSDDTSDGPAVVVYLSKQTDIIAFSTAGKSCISVLDGILQSLGQ